MLRFLYKFSIFVIWSHLLGADGAKVDDEIKDHSLSLTFYMMSSNKWSEKESGFKTELIKQVNTYCQQNKEKCGVKSTTTLVFSESDYKATEGYPKADSSNTQIQFYLTFPASINSGMLTSPPLATYLLNREAIQAVVLSSRPALKKTVGYWVTFIDDDQYGPPPNSDINNIMIPVACGLLLLLCIILIALYYQHKNRTAKEKRRKNEEMRSGKRRHNTVGPEPEAKLGVNGHMNGSTGGTEQWFVSESEHGEEKTAQHLSKGPPPYQIVEFPDHTRGRQELPPLNYETDEKRGKDKKKKKHKKHRKHGKEDPEQNQNSASDWDPEVSKPGIEKHKLISEQVQMSALSGRLTDPGMTRHQNVASIGQTGPGDSVFITPPESDDERLQRAGFV